MQLDIIIVGAGLAGLAAANGLRRAGHRVRIFEKSGFANEIGAGITVTANGSLVLKRWGFDFERTRAVVMRGNRAYDGETLEVKGFMEVNSGPEPEFFNLYRPDYHAELWRMAVAENGQGPPAIIRLGAEVKQFNAESGMICLSDGSSYTADLIIGADGIHSRIREIIVPRETVVKHTGANAYRFMGSTKDLEADPEIKALLDTKRHTWTGWMVGDLDVFLVWYDVRGGDLQNYVLQYASEDIPLSTKGTTQDEIKLSLLEDSRRLHPIVQKVVKTGRDLKPWKILFHEPLRTWIKGHSLLVGDAAHPVNPMNGQGVNTAVEDGATLQVLLSDIRDLNDLSARLRAFEDLRLPRTAIIQHLSNVLPGMEEQAAPKIEPYLRGHAPILSSADRNEFIFGYDAFVAAEQALKVMKFHSKLS